MDYLEVPGRSTHGPTSWPVLYSLVPFDRNIRHSLGLFFRCQIEQSRWGCRTLVMAVCWISSRCMKISLYSLARHGGCTDSCRDSQISPDNGGSAAGCADTSILHFFCRICRLVNIYVHLRLPSEFNPPWVWLRRCLHTSACSSAPASRTKFSSCTQAVV